MIERIIAGNGGKEGTLLKIEEHLDNSKVLVVEMGDHKSVIPFFQEFVATSHCVEAFDVLRNRRRRVPKD